MIVLQLAAPLGQLSYHERLKNQHAPLLSQLIRTRCSELSSHDVKQLLESVLV